MKELLGRLWKDESGQGMAEYGLILALIAVVVIAAALGLGDSISKKFSGVASEISAPRP